MASSWPDTQTKAMLDEMLPERLAPSDTDGFSLVLLRKGQEPSWVARSIARVACCSNAEAWSLCHRECSASVLILFIELQFHGGLLPILYSPMRRRIPKTRLRKLRDLAFSGSRYRPIARDPETSWYRYFVSFFNSSFAEPS